MNRELQTLKSYYLGFTKAQPKPTKTHCNLMSRSFKASSDKGSSLRASFSRPSGNFWHKNSTLAWSNWSGPIGWLRSNSISPVHSHNAWSDWMVQPTVEDRLMTFKESLLSLMPCTMDGEMEAKRRDKVSKDVLPSMTLAKLSPLAQQKSNDSLFNLLAIIWKGPKWAFANDKLTVFPSPSKNSKRWIGTLLSAKLSVFQRDGSWPMLRNLIHNFKLKLK